MQISTIAGPAVGGLVFLGGSVGGLRHCVAVADGLAALLMFRVSIGRSPPAHARETRSIGTLLSGITFVRSRPVVLGSISLDLFAVLFGGGGGAAAGLRQRHPARRADRAGPAPRGARRWARRSAVRCSPRGPCATGSGACMFGGVASSALATAGVRGLDSFVLSLAALVVHGRGATW